MKKVIFLCVLFLGSVFADNAISNADTLYKKCAGCHGQNGEKKALGKSKIIKDMTNEDIVNALEGYQDGSYGGSMKGVMLGQVKGLSIEEIQTIANHIVKSIGSTSSSPESSPVDNSSSSTPEVIMDENMTENLDSVCIVKPEGNLENGEKLFTKCISCHGKTGEKVALNKSKVIKDMSKEDIITALNGYKNSSYGGQMKGVMLGQVKGLSSEDILDIAEYLKQ